MRSGGANALSLAGYSDRDIKKMRRWRGGNFKEYIREELHYFAGGISTAMKQDFKFVNIAEGAYSQLVYVTRTTVVRDYHPATKGKLNYDYNLTVAKLLGNDGVNRWLKNPREGQYGIVFF